VVSWASSDVAVATVTATGVVSGLAPGKVTITATSEGVTGSLEVPVAYLFTDVAAGSDYTCAKTTGSAAFCWGAGDRGQLGIGSTSSSEPVPVAVSGGLRVVTLSANRASGFGRHTCALLEEGAVACWGDGALGQLGNGGSELSTTPVVLSGIPSMSAVVVGNAHTCAIAAEDATAYCWGLNSDGQLGIGDTLNRNRPTAVVGGLHFRSIAPGTHHTCATTTDGDLYCWGGNPNREYTVDTTGASLTPVPVAAPSALEFRTVSAGSYHTCALAEGGAAYCWGGGYEGQLGSGNLESSLTPVPVSGGLVFSSLNAGLFHTCATTAEHKAYCWGYNESEQLGQPRVRDCADGLFSCRPAPTELSGAVSFVTLSGSTQHTCGVTPSREIYCWGDNHAGQLGDGTVTDHTTPVLVESP
jgi:alpha-tubulin suppressor-like RCC1 family protein